MAVPFLFFSVVDPCGAKVKKQNHSPFLARLQARSDTPRRAVALFLAGLPHTRSGSQTDTPKINHIILEYPATGRKFCGYTYRALLLQLLLKAFILRLELQLKEQILCSSFTPNQLMNSGFVLPVARFLSELLTLLFSNERKIPGKTFYLSARTFFD